MKPHQTKKIDNSMLKKGFRIIGKSTQIDANSDSLQQILNYSHSFSKVKAVLGAVLSFKYGAEASNRAQEILFSMCTPSLKQIEGAKRLFKLEYGKYGEIYGITRPCYQDPHQHVQTGIRNMY